MLGSMRSLAGGRAHGDSSAAHRSVIARLDSSQRRAAELGWTAFALERAGGSGRLELRGRPPTGGDRELVPDAIVADASRPDDRDQTWFDDSGR